MSSRSESYDAVVVGAGPAGSASAGAIAAQGFRVLLVEEHAAIGLPSHCSGLVTPRTLALAGCGEAQVLNRIRGAVLHAPSGRELTIGGDRLHALALDRPRFDVALADRAQAAGAELALETKLVGIERTPGQVRLRLRRRHGEASVAARLLVGADGAQSRVARVLGSETLTSDRLVGLGAEVRLRSRRPDHVRVFLGNQIAPGFFAWLIPLGEGRARLGLATNGGRRPLHYLRALLESFPRVFAGVEVLCLHGGVLPLLRLRRIYADRAMLVGDAAGHVKPTSGGGIYTALLGARHCADVATRALTADRLDACSLAGYQTAWEQAMGHELERGRLLRRALLRLNDAQLDRLLSLLSSARLRGLIARHGDIDFPSRVALRAGVQRPALLGLLRGAARS